MEYILHAWAAVIDDHAVEMAGERFLQTLNSLAALSQARPGRRSLPRGLLVGYSVRRVVLYVVE